MTTQRRNDLGLGFGLLLALVLPACTGTIAGERGSGGETSSNAGDPGAAPGDDGGDTTGQVDWSAQGAVEPGPSYLRRLTNAEYDHTLHDLLKETGEVVVRSKTYDFVPDARVNGFDSNAMTVSMSVSVLERYRDAAEAISREVTDDVETRERVVGCDPEEDSGCVGDFIERFGREAYRRPLSKEELSELTALAESSADALGGVRLVIQHVLLSPNFLFRVEEGVADPEHPELLRLNGYEMATRLSYLLLGTTPTSELLDAAAAGVLDTAQGVAEAARSMLSDERARSAVRRFTDQWLRLDRVSGLTRDESLFPDFDAELAAAMREETTRLVDRFIWEPSTNFLDLISSPRTFMNARLADFYGAPAVQDWQLVDYPASAGRKGLLGHASVLALSARPGAASIILRGKYVREVLLCYAMPPVPVEVPKLPDPVPGQSEQERLARHSTDPSCAGCHSLMDPLGAGLANFDAIGKFTDVDSVGMPVSTRGELNGYPELEDKEFDGEVELAEKLRELPDLPRCVVTQMFRHAFARQEISGDSPLLSSVLEAFSGSGYDFKEMLVAFVTSDAFRYREPTEDQGDWE